MLPVDILISDPPLAIKSRPGIESNQSKWGILGVNLQQKSTVIFSIFWSESHWTFKYIQIEQVSMS